MSGLSVGRSYSVDLCLYSPADDRSSKYGSQFSSADYVHAGFPDYTYGRLQQIADHDLAQTEFLISVLGPNNSNIQPCVYDFAGLTTPTLFLQQAAVLKQVVASAYTGSLQNLDVAFSRATASIAVTEGRDQAFIESVLLNGSAWT